MIPRKSDDASLIEPTRRIRWVIGIVAERHKLQARLSDLPRLERLDEKFDKEPHVARLLLVEGVDGEQGVGVGLPVGEQSDQGAVRQFVRHEFIRYQDHPEPLHRRLFQGDAVVGAEAGGGSSTATLSASRVKNHLLGEEERL